MKRAFRFINLLAACTGILAIISTTSKAQNNTYYGVGALHSGTVTGLYESAFGFEALYHTTTGEFNTATGAVALYGNTGNDNTADGVAALFGNTTGSYNVAVGVSALRLNTTGTANTANGFQALYSNVKGYWNTADGYQALENNDGDASGAGSANTASGFQALQFNVDGYYNVADGGHALWHNVSGHDNTAVGSGALQANDNNGRGIAIFNTATGSGALYSNVNGNYNTAQGGLSLEQNMAAYGNTADGYYALFSNDEDDKGLANLNTADGYYALYFNIDGSGNTATGVSALAYSNGSNNTAFGLNAGSNLVTGSNNIDIGDYDPISLTSDDQSAENNTIRVGDTVGLTQKATYIAGIENATISGGAAVFISGSGQLGVESSSLRYKQDVKGIGDASEVVLSLRPVSFKYKAEIDPKGVPQFGLVAEEVQKVCPALVVHDKDGKPFTVRYEAVNAMLLNEFLKEHERVSRLEATVKQQQKDLRAAFSQIESLTASLKEEASLLQKVSDQVQVMKAKPEVVSNNQ